MLKLLTINNIAVIEHAEIEFSAGFNVLTGETGAGKSILIDSINAVLGERTSRTLIRTGCKRASVSALFEDVGAEIAELLSERGYEPEADGSVIIQRTISADGRSVCRICGAPAAASAVKEIANRLINIHGQHDSQRLLDSQSHIYYLDAVAENDSLKSEYAGIFRRVVNLKKELAALSCSEEEKTRRLSYLNYLISELEAAGIQPGETEKLKNRRQFYQNYEKLSELVSSCINMLDGDEVSSGASSLVSMAASGLEEAGRIEPSLAALPEKLRDAAYAVEEVSSALKSTADNLDFDAADQQATEERLDLLYRLTHKYSADESGLLELLESSKKEAEDITLSDERAAELEKELNAALPELQSCAARLTESRKAAGERFGAVISEELSFLNMPNVKFYAAVTPSRYTSNGADAVEFLISPNPGEEPRPLSKIASGGELSRIMLAIKSALSGKNDVATLIYDEIDAGISGLAAEKVGIKLRQTAASAQVICVTHLAQIASAADAHMLIEKHVEGERTFTSVNRLDFDGRVREIARIMGGANVTPSVLESAGEMILSHSGAH